MNLPIRCMASGCGHRFERTAAEVLADGRCPRCASTDIDVDEGGLEVSAALPAEPAAIAMEPASEVNQETARCAFCMKTFAYRSADPTEPVPACPHCGATATTPAGAAGMHTASDAVGDCPGSGEFVHPIVGTNMNGWATNTMQGACPSCGQRFMGWILNDGVKIPPHKASHHSEGVRSEGRTSHLLRTASKIEEIARSVLSTNPGMTPREAVTIANETVRRYPKVVG